MPKDPTENKSPGRIENDLNFKMCYLIHIHIHGQRTKILICRRCLGITLAQAFANQLAMLERTRAMTRKPGLKF